MTDFSWVINKKDYYCHNCVHYDSNDELVIPHCLICRHSYGAHEDGKIIGGRFTPDLYKEKAEEK